MKTPRQLLRCGAVAALCSFAFATFATAAEVELKAISSFPKSHRNTKGFLSFVEEVNKAGKGIVHIKYLGGPEVAPPQQQPVALRNGLTDFVFGPSAYYLGMFPEGDFTAGFKTPMEARTNGGFKLVDDVMRKKLGATFIARFNSGLGLYMTLKEKPEIKNGLPDLTGMKIRSSPAYRDFIKVLGGTAVVMPITQIYTALERGVVEGAGGDLDSVQEWGLYKFLKYWIDPPFNMAGILIIANAKKWDSLPANAKELIQKIAAKHEQITMDNIAARTKEVKEFMLKHGMKEIKLTGEDAKHYVDTYMATPWGRMRKNPNVKVDVEALHKAWY
jgi:TRAP-type C4-dicarboxylate transport system substrate-binding protein